MLVSLNELEKFSGVIRDDEDTLGAIYINTATEIINNYVGYDVENNDVWATMPDVFKLVCLEIATLIQGEEGSNIGVNTSQDFGVNRSFLNVVNYDKYLQRLAAYRLEDATKM